MHQYKPRISKAEVKTESFWKDFLVLAVFVFILYFAFGVLKLDLKCSFDNNIICAEGLNLELSEVVKLEIIEKERNSHKAIDKSCEHEGSLRSVAARKLVKVVFKNKSKYDLQVFWIDYNGGRVKYSDLYKGRKYKQGTYISHPWLIATKEGRCVKIFSTENDKEVFVIRDRDIK